VPFFFVVAGRKIPANPSQARMRKSTPQSGENAGEEIMKDKLEERRKRAIIIGNESSTVGKHLNLLYSGFRTGERKSTLWF
jgi:hypothetical protein